MGQRKHKYNPLYKNFLRLKVNPLGNDKFLKLEHRKVKFKVAQKENKEKFVWKWFITTKKEKWNRFLKTQIQSHSFSNKYRPCANYSYGVSKFASQGNSFKKRFKNSLLAKTTFNYLYGGLSQKYLKAHMRKIYRLKNIKNLVKACTEFFESRVDSILYKAKFCSSVKNARQLIAHKHIKVNNLTEKNKARVLRKGDVLTINQKSFRLIQRNLKEKFQKCPDHVVWPLPPKYLDINYKTLEIIVGDIENFNFSSSFRFKPDIYSVIVSSYRD